MCAQANRQTVRQINEHMHVHSHTDRLTDGHGDSKQAGRHTDRWALERIVIKTAIETLTGEGSIGVRRDRVGTSKMMLRSRLSRFSFFFTYMAGLYYDLVLSVGALDARKTG